MMIAPSTGACDCEQTVEEQSKVDDQESGLTVKDITQMQISGQSEGWTFTVGKTSATHYNLESLCGFQVPDNWWEEADFDPCAVHQNLPDEFDWRDIGGVDYTTPIKNQGSCGSCWAFATVAPLECNIKYTEGSTVDLSEQWLVSCNQDGWGCNGGWWAHDYHQWKTDPCGDTGAVLEQHCPYTASDSSCDCPYPHSYVIQDWSFIGSEYNIPTVDAIKQAIIDYGPVSVAVTVNSAFQAYTGGIFNDCSSEQVNHAVTLVGWDDTQGSNGVWFLRNSWGGGWGEDGYMRIAYGCSNIGYSACYVNYLPLGDKQVDIFIQKLTNDPAEGFDPIDQWLDLRGGVKPEWYYRIGFDDSTDTRYHFGYNRDLDDWWMFQWISEHTWTVEQQHCFFTDDTLIDFTIKLMDDDILTDDDLADISAEPGGGADNNISDKRSAIYHGTYNLATNQLTGDSVEVNQGYQVTIGDGINNGKLWFQISDTYEPQPQLSCTGSLQWTEVEPEETVTDTFTLQNTGDPYSELDWTVESYPEWGTWSFQPQSGTDITPDMGSITVEVTVVAPAQGDTAFTGELVIQNTDNLNDQEIISISLTTPQPFLFDTSLIQRIHWQSPLFLSLLF